MTGDVTAPEAAPRKQTASGTFYGWRIVAACFFTLGLSVGMPYFGMPFFYDYFEKPVAAGGYGWSRSAITLGLPLGTLVTVWISPMLAHRFPPRRMILAGTAITALTLTGFGLMNGDVRIYWLLWLLYMVGNVLGGSVSHSAILAQWFVRKRGTAIAAAYLGISLIGALAGRLLIQPLASRYGVRATLLIMGAMLFLTWPLVLFVMRERPADMGLAPDGDIPLGDQAPDLTPAMSLGEILRSPAFQILVTSGACTAAAFGAISQHLKLMLKDSGMTDQIQLNLAFSQAMLLLLVISASARLLIGRLADHFPKQRIMTVTFMLFALALACLYLAPQTTWLFAALFGLAMGGDYLLISLLAGDYFHVRSLGRVFSILLPVMTLGQAWLPFLISVLREKTGAYATPMAVILLFAVLGRFILVLLPAPPATRHAG
ncbi:MAG: MFS transporter [Blastocatellia bacterium]